MLLTRYSFPETLMPLDLISELSKSTLASYAIRASAAKHHHEKKADRADDLRTDTRLWNDKGIGGPPTERAERRATKIMNYHDHVAKKRERGLDRAVSKLAENIGAGTNTDPNRDRTSEYTALNKSSTTRSSVIKKHTQREKNLYDTNKTNLALNNVSAARSARNDVLHDRYRNRWRLSQLKHLSAIKTHHVAESLDYINNLKLIHDNHAEASKKLANSERDPELKRIDNHRSKKHAHASAVLDRLLAATTTK